VGDAEQPPIAQVGRPDASRDGAFRVAAFLADYGCTRGTTLRFAITQVRRSPLTASHDPPPAKPLAQSTLLLRLAPEAAASNKLEESRIGSICGPPWINW
jgi:hypothetical protein